MPSSHLGSVGLNDWKADREIARNGPPLRPDSALDRQLGIVLRELENIQSPYRILGDIVDFGVWVCDAAGRNVYISQSMLDLLGHSFEEVEELGWAHFLHPDDVAEALALGRVCVETGTPWNHELRYRAWDGQYKDILARGKPVRDRDGNIVMWVGLNLDITDLKQTERALITSNTETRALNEALAREVEKGKQDRERLDIALGASGMIGIWDGDLRRGLVIGDGNFARIYGLDPGDTLAGKPLGYYIDQIHPEDAPSAKVEMDRMKAGADGYSHEHRIIRPDGSIRWVLAKGRLVRDPDGTPVRFPGISVDITERKLAERRQAFLLALEESLRRLDRADDIVLGGARYLGMHLGADRVGYAEIDAEAGIGLVRRDWCGTGMPTLAGSHRLANFGAPVIEAATLGETLRIDDVATDPRTAGTAIAATFDAIATRAAITVPLIKDGRLVAVLFVHQCHPRRWTEDEVSLCNDVAERTWSAVERAQVEVLLRESEQRVRLALESGGFGSWEFDVATGATVRSPRHDQIFGYAAPIPDWSYDRFIQLVLPEDRGWVAAQYQEMLQTDVERRFEFRIAPPAQEERWIEIRAKPHMDEVGNVVKLLGTVADITERKRTEAAALESAAQFRVLAKVMPNHVWTASPSGHLDWFNDRVFAYTGLPFEALEGSGWTSIIHPEDLPDVERVWVECVATGRPLETELRMRRADGTFRWHIARGVAVYADDGRIIRWIGANTDIEDQKTAAQTLARLNVTLEEQVRQRSAELIQVEESLRQSQKMEAVGQLTGGLAHDFNNLLTAISGNLELIEQRMAQGRAEDLDRYLNAAQSATTRAAALTHRLLAFSRRQTLDPKPTDINRLVDDMDDLVRRTVGPAAGVEVIKAPGLWTTLVDPNQLENALLNLCINARDAMPEGGTITIESANLRLDGSVAKDHDLTPGDYVSLAVSDIGSGMSPEVIARAFDPFFTTKPLGEGTGLGLSMVYGFVRQSGGQARIESEIGRGTTVRLYLPRYDGDHANATPSGATTDARRAQAGETVLIVDDEASVRRLVVEVLEELGYVAIEAADGGAGLQIIDSRRRIDLLVTDVGLPGMNGRQLADAALMLRPDLKILFITGYAETAVICDAHLKPGMHVLTKPFALDLLARRIQDIVTGPPGLMFDRPLVDRGTGHPRIAGKVVETNP